MLFVTLPRDRPPETLISQPSHERAAALRLPLRCMHTCPLARDHEVVLRDDCYSTPAAHIQPPTAEKVTWQPDRGEERGEALPLGNALRRQSKQGQGGRGQKQPITSITFWPPKGARVNHPQDKQTQRPANHPFHTHTHTQGKQGLASAEVCVCLPPPPFRPSASAVVRHRAYRIAHRETIYICDALLLTFSGEVGFPLLLFLLSVHSHTAVFASHPDVTMSVPCILLVRYQSLQCLMNSAGRGG